MHRLLHSNVGEFEKLLQIASEHGIKLNILPDSNQQTPLHLCVEKSLSRAASLLLDTISKYPLNDHGFFINNALKDAMMLCPISLAKYMENRVFKPSWGVTQTEGELKKQDASCEFGVASLPLKVYDRSQLQESLFVQHRTLPAPEEDLSTQDDNFSLNQSFASQQSQQRPKE